MSSSRTSQPTTGANAPSSASSAAVGRISSNVARLADMALLTLSFLIAIGSYLLAQPARDGRSLLNLQVSVKHLILAAAGWSLWALCLWSTGIYHGSRKRSMRQVSWQVLLGTTFCTLVAALGLLPRYRTDSLARPLMLFWLGSATLMLGSRALRRAYLRRIKPRMREPRRALIIGSGPRAQQLARELPMSETFHYELIGFLDSEPQPGPDHTPVPIIGSLADLESILMRQQVDDVFIALPMRSAYEHIQRVLSLCEQTGVQSQYLTDLFPTTIAKRRVAAGDGAADRIVVEMVYRDHRRHIKRALDLFGATVGLLLLSPVMLAVAIAIKLTSPGPIFFSQVRFGLNKRKFSMYKFRSMVPDAEKLQAGLEHANESGGPVFKIKHDPRITPIGAFIRKTSIDELPQLVNVLLGQMSLVGPRPLPMRDVSNFSESSLMRRFSVKPGMTGLWQVSGRSNTTFSGWISMDLHYIDNWSLEMDTRILLRTVSVVVRGSGAS